MPLLAFLGPLVGWIFRSIVIKFVTLTAVFSLLAIIIPIAINLVLPYVGVTSLSSAFGGLDSGVWWVLDIFALDYGVPLVIAAFVTRFLIRRLPVIG